MTEKRYAIVRVDGVCPLYNDKYFNRKSKNFCENRFNCSDYRYGDTKEQLIRKVAQVIERRFARNYRFGVLVDEIKNGLAKEIVEFLGVEE